MQQCRWAGVWNTKNAAVGFEKKGSLASRIKLVPKGSNLCFLLGCFLQHSACRRQIMMRDRENTRPGMARLRARSSLSLSMSTCVRAMEMLDLL